MILQGKRSLVTGGTGTLGKILKRRLLASELGTPRQFVVFSRDKAKQHFMRTEYQTRAAGASDYVCQNFHELVTFRIGDIRDYASVNAARRGEKTHEILVSEEEAHRTAERDEKHYIILPALPELHDPAETRSRLTKEFRSAEHLLSLDEIKHLLTPHHMRVADHDGTDVEKDLLC